MNHAYRVALALSLAIVGIDVRGETFIIGATGGAAPTYTFNGFPASVISVKAGDRARIYTGVDHPLATFLAANSTNGIPNSTGPCPDANSQCTFLFSNNDGGVGDQFYDFFCTMHVSQGMSVEFDVSFNDDLIMVTDFEKPLIPNPTN
jgi:hypothetical protein